MKITIYVTYTCPWSIKLIKWLKRHRYKFEEWDVAEPQNKEARDQWLNKTNKLIVPTIDVDGHIIIGFNEKELDKTLKKLKAQAA